MDPGEYRTNVLSFNNFASINYEYYEVEATSPGTARKHLQRVEAAWRGEGKLSLCDNAKDGLWFFQQTVTSNASPDSSQDDHGSIPESGLGIFEPASLARTKQGAFGIANTPSNNSSPSSSLENALRNAQALNARAVQGNASYNNSQDLPSLSPGLKTPNEVWPSTKDIHESFISAVLGSLMYLLCRDEGFIPLNSRTLILNTFKESGHFGLVGSSLQVANAINLATLEISLTSLGTLVIKAHSDSASGLHSLMSSSSSIDLKSKLAPGATLRLAPGGNTAKFCCMHDHRGPSGSSTALQLQASASDSRIGNLSSATIKAWQSKCLEWLSARGLSTDAIESGGWLLVQVNNQSSYPTFDNQGMSNFDGVSVIPWPALLCFPTSSPKGHGTDPYDTFSSHSRDPLSFAEDWLGGRDDRASLMLKRQKERQVAEALSKEQADVEARALQSNIYSPAVLRRGSNAGAMYPTPPDAIHHPIGVTPSFDGAGSTPGHPNMYVSHDTVPAAPATSGVLDADMDLWGSGVKKESATGNGNFVDNDNDAGDLFGDIGGDIFGNDITDADFSFFDEPDDIMLDSKPSSHEISKQSMPQENGGFSAPYDDNGKPADQMSAVDTIMQNQNALKPKDNIEEPLPSAKMDDDQVFAVPKSKSVVLKEGGHQMKPPKVSKSPPFNQKVIFERLIRDQKSGNGISKPRRASLFNKVDFEKSLSLVDEKYGAHGQYKFSPARKGSTRDEALQLPQTDYLASRRKAQNAEPDASIIARILIQDKVVEKPDTIEPMEFLIDSDSVSQVSEQDDTSLTTDDTSFIPRLGLDHNWLGDSIQGDPVSGSFDPMAIDIEPSVSTPQSATGSQMPLLEPDPADWSLTSYFTSPEPEGHLSTLSDFERIATAQILADQAISGTLKLPKLSGNQTDSCKNKAMVTRALVRALTKSAKSFFKDVTACSLKLYLEIPGIPVLNQGLRLPPRPMNPRGPNSMEMGKPNNPFAIPPPQLELRRSDSKLSVLPSATRFWENLGLGPAKGNKNVYAVCVFPSMDGLAANANTFLDQIRSTYESYRLGGHEKIVSKEVSDGLISFPYDLDRSNILRHMTALQETAAELSRTFSSLAVEEKNFVVYFVYPTNDASLLVHICSAFQHLFNLFRKALTDKKAKPSNELVLQLVPLDFIASPTSIVVPLPSDYARLAMEVYDRCIDFTSSSSSPAIMLEQPLPRGIDFKLNANPSAAVLQENSCFHIAYAQSIDDRWITAVWTDNRGTQQMTASYCLGRKNEPISMPFAEVAHEIWETTLDFIASKKIHWRIMIARVGVMDPTEIEFWSKTAASETDAQINLTLLTVQPDPSLRLLPPAITLTANSTQAQSITPVSTPQAPTSVVSPETSSTPNPPPQNNAPTPTSTTATDTPLEPDSDARLLDVTDQSWAVSSLTASTTPIPSSNSTQLSSQAIFSNEQAHIIPPLLP
ncbi:mediator complex subunit 13 C-terminal-domain-containing protein [Halenospora varia]|nr:mediator complex subunit 13 C-terminal-domain-containing protein [Halenospora varia]